MARILSLVVLALLPFFTGCGSLEVNVHPGNLWVGVQPTWATNKQIDGFSGSTNINTGPQGTQTSSNQNVRMSYDLGDKRCSGDQRNAYQGYNAPGKANDSHSSQYGFDFNCRPLTPAEMAERIQARKALEAAIAAETAKAAAAKKPGK